MNNKEEAGATAPLVLVRRAISGSFSQKNNVFPLSRKSWRQPTSKTTRHCMTRQQGTWKDSGRRSPEGSAGQSHGRVCWKVRGLRPVGLSTLNSTLRSTALIGMFKEAEQIKRH